PNENFVQYFGFEGFYNQESWCYVGIDGSPSELKAIRRFTADLHIHFLFCSSPPTIKGATSIILRILPFVHLRHACSERWVELDVFQGKVSTIIDAVLLGVRYLVFNSSGLPSELP